MGAVALLAAESGLSHGRIKKAMQQGAVWLTRGKQTERLRRAKRSLYNGDTLHLYYNPAILEQSPPPATLIEDCGAFSVWNKPAGMLSQGSKWGDHTTLYRWAEQQLQPQRPAFIVHRLDRAAQGLMLLAHSKKAAQTLSALFAERKIEKRYQAQVHGCYQEQHPQVIRTPIDEKSAESEITPLQSTPPHSLLEVVIKSGRKHQIRRHLSEAGFPIVGDHRYGEDQPESLLHLCSCHLAFTFPLDGNHYQFDLTPAWRSDG